MRGRFELKFSVKIIEDFFRRFIFSRLISGSSSIGSLVIKFIYKSGFSFLFILFNNSTLFRLEERLG